MSSSDQKPSVLFVCLGNICRSPMAEGAFRAAAEAAGLDCEVASVGTADYHVGEMPDRRAIAVAKANGVDISWLYGEQIETEHFYTFTHILAMDVANLEGVKARAPRDASAHIALLLDALEGREGQAVKDPYYGDESDFEAVWAELTLATQALVERLKKEGAAARF